MFDIIMENSMPIWMLVSGLFPIFLIAMIVKAALHLRRLRALADNIPETPMAASAWTENEDWIPSP